MSLLTTDFNFDVYCQPPKSASLRDAGFAAPSGAAGMGLLPARAWPCEDL